MSIGRQQAFELFKRDYRDNETIERHKSQLREKYAAAKRLGETVNSSRGQISKSSEQLVQCVLTSALVVY